jgi:acetoin utilization protein AcuB
MAMLRVKDLMSNALEVVSPDAHLHDVLAKMNRAGYRHLPVVAEDKLVGIITDRDLRLAVNSPVVREGADLKREMVLDEVQVVQCMTPDPQCVSSDTPAHEVADLLSLNKFGAMPVVDEGKLVGMISYIDFLKHYAANRQGS